jgi:gluconolactonase
MQSAIHVADPALRNIVDAGAGVEKIAGGFRFTEGPVFSRIGFMLFSDLPAERIMKYDFPPGRPGPGNGELSVFREKSNRANGLTFDHQGRLLACEGGAGRVTRTEKDSRITVLAGRYEGRSLNAPNDLVYAIDGSVYFSDLRSPKAPADSGKTDFSAVYQITAKGDVRIAAREPERPNGVALSPKQDILYVADSARQQIWAFEIAGDGALSKGRVLAELKSDQPGAADGLKTDEAGNIYVAGPGGVWILTAAGKHLGTITVPETPSNCAWGRGFSGLYITARTSVYHVPTKVPGTRTF